MAKPIEKVKLPPGVGTLARYSANGPWSLHFYDRSRRKNVCQSTGEVNRSKAEHYAYQHAAVRNKSHFRYQGAALLFSSAAQEYIKARNDGLRYKRLRTASMKSLNTALNAFRNFMGDGYDGLLVDKIDADLLQRFVDTENCRVRTTTANGYLDAIAQVVRFSYKNHWIMTNPATQVERAIDHSLDEDDDDALIGWPCPTPEEVRRILARSRPQLIPTGQIADNGSETGRPVYRGINKNDYSDYYRTICMTGLRRGEIRFLTWDDVDLNSRIIRIRSGYKNGVFWQPKTRCSARRIAIVPDLEAIFVRLRQTNRKNRWVFETKRGTQIHGWNPTKRLGEICQELGMERHYVLHSLRKYWASTVAQQGMDWKVMIKMFGHTDFKLILSTYYAQNDEARLLEEASKIDYGLGLSSAG